MLENHFLDPCEFQEKQRYWIQDNPIPTNGWFQNDLHQEKWARNGLSKCQIDGTVDVGHFWFKRKYWGEATLKKERLSKWIAIFWPLYIHTTWHIYSDIMYYHVNHPHTNECHEPSNCSTDINTYQWTSDGMIKILYSPTKRYRTASIDHSFHGFLTYLTNSYPIDNYPLVNIQKAIEHGHL